MANRFVKYICAGATALLLAVGCDSEDVVIDGTGMLSDSTVVYLPVGGTANSFIVTSLYPWTSEYVYSRDAEWLSYDPREGEMPEKITLTATANDYRRRSGWLLFDNGYHLVYVNVIQYAPADYEPGPVVLSENFGLTEVAEDTDVNEYTSWSRTGNGSSNVRYSGTDAVVQATVDSETGSSLPEQDGAYPDASMGNNVWLKPGGSFLISGIGITNYQNFILTLYVAGRSVGSWLADPAAALLIEGGTFLDELKPVPAENIDLSENLGWYRTVAEFKKIEGATSVYLRFTNTGSADLYLDDILLESAGRGTLEIGTPVPVVTTLTATNVTSTGATLRGSYTLPEQITSVARAGIEYRLNTVETRTVVDVPSAVAETEFSINITGADGEIYYYRAFAEEGGRITYGTELSVELIEAPTDEDDPEDE